MHSPAIERPTDLEVGAIVSGRYRIVGRLGKGGMGAVYEATDERLGTLVALKESFAVDERLRLQFAGEARLLASLHHAALPRVTDYFVDGSRAFLVMEFIEGADLAEILVTQPGPFPRERVIAWADQLLDALIYLHHQDRQIIHRDIKPHNLKLTSAGTIALLDFGLAKQSSGGESDDSVVSVFGYTRRYAPLEQIQDRGTTERSDIYALGATLYHLLTGSRPVDAETRAAAIEDPLCRADLVLPVLGSELGEILRKAMALCPEDRYGTAFEFREALRGLGRVAVSQGPEGGWKRHAPVGSLFNLDDTEVVERGEGLRPGGIRFAGAAILLVAGASLLLYFVGSRPLLQNPGSVSGAVVGVGPISRSVASVVSRPEPLSVPEKVATVPSRRVRVKSDPEVIALVKKPSVAERASGKQVSTAVVAKKLLKRKETVAKSDQRVAPALGPRILRAPDGTEVLKYPDGHVEVFGPGERKAN